MAFDINDLDPDLFPDDEPLELRPEGGGAPQAEGAPAPEANDSPSLPSEPEGPPVVHEPQVDSIQPNRPAEGALRATAETELNKSWQGGEGAADFLGLDEEMRAPAPQQVPQPAPQQPAQQAPDLGGAIPLHEPAPAEPVADEGLFGGGEEQSWLLENNEKPLHVPGTPSNQEGEGEPEPALAGAAAGATFVEHSAGPGKGKLAAMVVGLMLLAGAATFFLSPRDQQESEEAAQGLEPGRAPLQAPRNRPRGSTELTDPDGPPPTLERTPLSEVVLPSDEELLAELRELAGVVLDGPIRLAEESSTEEVVPEPEEFSPSNPLAAFPPESMAGEAARTAAPSTPFGLPVAGAGNSPWETAMRAAESFQTPGEAEASEGAEWANADSGEAARASRTTQILPDSNALLPSVEAILNRADDEDLANLWPGTEPPLDQMKREGQLLTPRVGRVRVLIEDDEIFEGELYAVGSGNLWLDTRLGRLALEAPQVQEVVRISGSADTPTLGGKNAQNLTGLARVGVRAPGGTIYGKVVKQDGDHVTLIPDVGGRITLDGVEVEGLSGEVRTTIVRLADASEMSR